MLFCLYLFRKNLCSIANALIVNKWNPRIARLARVASHLNQIQGRVSCRDGLVRQSQQLRKGTRNDYIVVESRLIRRVHFSLVIACIVKHQKECQRTLLASTSCGKKWTKTGKAKAKMKMTRN